MQLQGSQQRILFVLYGVREENRLLSSALELVNFFHHWCHLLGSQLSADPQALVHVAGCTPRMAFIAGKPGAHANLLSKLPLRLNVNVNEIHGN